MKPNMGHTKAAFARAVFISSRSIWGAWYFFHSARGSLLGARIVQSLFGPIGESWLREGLIPFPETVELG